MIGTTAPMFRSFEARPACLTFSPMPELSFSLSETPCCFGVDCVGYFKISVASRRATFCFSFPIPALKASGRMCEALYTRLSLTKAGMRRKLLDLAVAPILEALQMLSKWKLNDVNCKRY